MVDLEHPWLELMVQHHIKAKKIAAYIGFLGLTCSVQVLQLRLHNDDRFDYYRFDFLPNLLCSLPIRFSFRAIANQHPFKNVF